MRTFVLLIFAMMISGIALAHEGHDHAGEQDQHVKGTVESVGDTQFKVKSTDGKRVDVHVDDRTRFENSGAPGKLADLKVGAKVVVHGARMKDGMLHAKEVRFGKTRPK